jgi:hypothetical protein
MAVCVVVVMQTAFWYRLRHVPIPFRHPNAILSHLLLFLARVGFIFGSALFSVAVFRHLPELGGDTDVLLVASRGVILVASLFALFCASLEIERLGRAFDGNLHCNAHPSRRLLRKLLRMTITLQIPFEHGSSRPGPLSQRRQRAHIGVHRAFGFDDHAQRF